MNQKLSVFLRALVYILLIPFGASVVGLGVCVAGVSELSALIVVPGFCILMYVLLRKRLNPFFGARVSGCCFLLTLLIFTILMLIGKGNVNGTAVVSGLEAMVPFYPIVLILELMGETDLCYLVIFITYLASALVLFTLAGRKIAWKKAVVPVCLTLICTVTSTVLYVNRPEKKYGGHGFKYMNGYSSTDFTDYTVYAENSKLVTLDHEAAIRIEDEAEMPILDGAEACYPLYAALAKAVYQDIDGIEKAALGGDTDWHNGKIVTFTNTIRAFDRLIYGAEKDMQSDRVDMFFGARPSASQQAEAADCGVELTITPIGREAFVFFVEEDNPVYDLTADQIRAIYHGDITNWKEVGGKDCEIRAFQRPANSGSQTMMEYFMGDVELKKPMTYEMVDSMAGVINEVAQYANEAGAMGYSFRYFLEGLNQEGNVKILSVDGVMPTIETIEDGSYPLTTALCLITRTNDPNPNVQKMIDFILSEDGQYIVRQTGYGGLVQ